MPKRKVNKFGNKIVEGLKKLVKPEPKKKPKKKAKKVKKSKK
jgi:hypothetical protein